VTSVDRRGQTSRFTYDSLNRLVSETYEDSTVARSYDAAGRASHIVDSLGGTFGFSYDVTGGLIEATAPVGTVRYVRDALGRVTERQVVGLSTIP
jgi:YD repeat-containing protein